MTEVDEFFRSAHNDLIYELEMHGFLPVDEDSWTGEIRTPNAAWQVKVDFSSPYPTFPPRVLLVGDKPLSWHQNADGSLCLYSQSSPGAFPWFAHGAFLAKVREWLENDETGWIGDTPDLDLERYWEPNTRFALLVHDELPGGKTYWARFDRSGPETLVQSGYEAPPRKRPRSHKHLYGLVADIGEIEAPPRTWAQLSALLEDSVNIETELREHRADVLLVRYARADHQGLLGLVPVPGGQPTELKLRSVSCASRSPRTMALRAGFQSSDLRKKVVTVVGVGAVGSFVAQGLFRAGLRDLVLVDVERLRPGNLARHAASCAFIGKPKAEAMARTLGATVLAFPFRVDSLTCAIRIVNTADLVIDATANEVVTQLLTEAGRLAGRTVLSTYLANQGRSKVVEILPSAADDRLVPQELPPAAADGVESGCGDPISTTPPFAVMEIAGMTCRIATAMLVGETAMSELREQT